MAAVDREQTSVNLSHAGSDGALIGPFNGWLHFPQFGKPAWDFNKSLWEHSVLPAAIHQLVILVTAAKLGARYEIYGHEYFARRAGLGRAQDRYHRCRRTPQHADPATRVSPTTWRPR